jgi:mannose-1-phosphate guanylyltransferase
MIKVVHMTNDAGGSDARAAIILAGGDGARLLSLTRLIAGKEVPKQFCSLDGKKTLLDYTRDRAALTAPQSNTVIVVNRQHQHFYQPLNRGISDECLIEQTANRGTTPAILHAAIKIERKLGRNAIATIFPSDHY